MRLVYVTTEAFVAPVSYDGEADQTWMREETMTMYDTSGNWWNVVTVESAREDYACVVPSRTRRP
jgi:hypothetical protein